MTEIYNEEAIRKMREAIKAVSHKEWRDSEQGYTSMTKNTCGGCTFCCMAMEVRELNKPKDQWCVHADKGKGCSIYNSRPQGCHLFQCLWLGSNWPDQSLRPDKAKVMFVGSNKDRIVMCMVHKDYPNAWREGRVKKFIDQILERNHVIIIWKEKRTFIGGKAPLAKELEQELSKLSPEYFS